MDGCVRPVCQPVSCAPSVTHPRGHLFLRTQSKQNTGLEKLENILGEKRYRLCQANVHYHKTTKCWMHKKMQIRKVHSDVCQLCLGGMWAGTGSAEQAVSLAHSGIKGKQYAGLIIKV